MFKPLLTEKSVNKNNDGTYVFSVSIKYNKAELKKMIEETFKVNVLNINTLIKRGKIKRFKNRPGQQKTIKKAIFTLAKGQIIPGFEKEKDSKIDKKTKKEVKA